ncbi:MAG: phosphatase PAP2 family protein [bacterium]
MKISLRSNMSQLRGTGGALLRSALHSSRSSFVRPILAIGLGLSLLTRPCFGQASDTSQDKTFLTRRDLLVAGLGLGVTGIVAHYDKDIARASQEPRFQGKNVHDFALNVSKVNETTLTLAGIATYGVARLSHSALISDVALHATESVVLASLASQLIRGPLGRTRPYVTHDSDQYNFKVGKGFFGKSSFDNRAFPSIHTSSSMAVATVITMETQRRSPGAAYIVAPLVYGAALLPGLARIELDQHWGSDIVAGAIMGVFAGYKVVSYSHAHPNNWFDRVLLTASVAPNEHGGLLVSLNPTF